MAVLRVHVMVVLVEVEQSHPVPVPETKLSPPGSGSLTVYVPLEAAVPPLETVTVYTPLVPWVKLPLWLLAMVRSVSPLTVVGSLALLLPVLVSPPPDTDAVLVTPPTAPAPTATVSVIAGALPETGI
jgi:hypothetical protein